LAKADLSRRSAEREGGWPKAEQRSRYCARAKTGAARGATLGTMTTKRVLALLLVVMTMTVAVARSRQGLREDADTRAYAVTGVVTSPPADGRVMVAHEEIADYMPAMTMPFALTPSETPPAMAVGDRVRFTLTVSADRTWAQDFTVTGHDPAVAAALAGPPSPTSVRVKKGDALPAVSLVTQTGAPFTTREFEGRVTAVTFVFTRCPVPEFCPLMVKRFQQVQRAMLSDPTLADARLLAVSLDPTFDTPPVLDAYARAMQADPARWTFVTGPSEEITRLTRAFAVHVERNGVLLDHTLATAVIGPDGRVVDLWRGNGWKADDIVAAMRAAAASTE
jgi:protein SCO1/2